MFLDYIQLVGSDEQRDSRQETINKISRSIKLIARELNCPVFSAAQINRNAEQRAENRPMMADLRESGALEQDADIVILLFRPDYYKPEDQPGILELIVSC